jgi:hypothetical protein
MRQKLKPLRPMKNWWKVHLYKRRRRSLPWKRLQKILPLMLPLSVKIIPKKWETPLWRLRTRLLR